MSKEILHTDSLSDVTVPEPIIPVPGVDSAGAPVYRSLGWVYAIDRKLAWLMRVTMFSAMILLGLLMAAQVFMRYVISLPFLGMEEMAPMLAVWIYFIGMAYCSRERDHIEGGVMTLLTQNRQILLSLRLLGSIVCFVALLFFFKYGYDFASFNIQVNRKSTYMRLPKYLWDFSMIFGLALMSFYMALQIFLEARALFTGKGGE